MNVPHERLSLEQRDGDDVELLLALDHHGHSSNPSAALMRPIGL